MDLLQNFDIDCPYCGELIRVMVDCSVSPQEYIEDCQVCCRPINFYVTIDNNDVQIHVSNENE